MTPVRRCPRSASFARVRRFGRRSNVRIGFAGKVCQCVFQRCQDLLLIRFRILARRNESYPQHEAASGVVISVPAEVEMLY